MVTKKTTTKKPAKHTAKAKTKVIKKGVPVKPEILEITRTVEESMPTPGSKTLNQATEKYYEAVGRRKESTARVRVYTKKSTDVQVSEEKALIEVNGKPYYEYFKAVPLQNIVESPLRKLKSMNRFKATVRSSGGGIHGQADAIKHGLSRALVMFDPNFSKKLRKAGYLTRDARAKERRKYGLKKARKAPQWAKR